MGDIVLGVNYDVDVTERSWHHHRSEPSPTKFCQSDDVGMQQDHLAPPLLQRLLNLRGDKEATNLNLLHSPQSAMTLYRYLLLFFLLLQIVSAGKTCNDKDKTCSESQSNKMKLKELWAKGAKETVLTLGGIYEHSAWVAEALVKQPDYAKITTVSGLAEAMKAIVDAASETQKMALLKAHPDLAQKVEKLSELTADSQEEQSKAGLQSMTKEEKDQFTKLNTEYKTKFNFPFILAVRQSTKFTVLSALAGRVQNAKETEIVTAIQQVHKIAWMRILAKLESDDPAGFLTCHVLDTANGCPGELVE